MSSNKYSALRLAFAIAFPCVMAVPAFCLLGIRERDRLCGFEEVLERPKIEAGAYFDRELRQRIAAWYGQNFFLRTRACKFRNLLYTVANGYAMFDQSGNVAGITSLADGALFSKDYLLPYLSNKKYDEAELAPALETIAEIVRLLRAKGIATMFILAPDKTQLYPSAPARFVSTFWRRYDIVPQREFSKLLAKYGIPAFDAYSYLKSRQPEFTETMFPYAGVHWNALASSLTAEEVLRRINAAQPDSSKFRINPFMGVRQSPVAKYGDDDLGVLQNLPFNPFLARNVRYVPAFKYAAFEPNPGSVLIWGDSFLAQIWFSLGCGGMFAWDKILVCDKRFIPVSELQSVSRDLQLMLFVYQPPHTYNLENKFGAMLRDLLSSLRGIYARPFRDFQFSEVDLPIWTSCGFYGSELWGRWTSGTVRMSFALPGGTADGNYRFAVKARTCTGLKEADVFCDNVKVAHWRVEQFDPEERIFEIAGKKPGDLVTIRIEQTGLARPCDMCPGNNDVRLLGLGFVSMRQIR